MSDGKTQPSQSNKHRFAAVKIINLLINQGN